jgi:hypothetical protein
MQLKPILATGLIVAALAGAARMPLLAQNETAPSQQYLPFVVNSGPSATATATQTNPIIATETSVATQTSTATATQTLEPTNTLPPDWTPTAEPTPNPPSYNSCRDDPYANQAPEYPIKITGINKQAETVTLRNLSGQTIDLTGWTMCSIRGNQLHDGISGTIGAGEQRTYPNNTGNIWNNIDQDNGALYNPQGQLISYWRDN